MIEAESELMMAAGPEGTERVAWGRYGEDLVDMVRCLNLTIVGNH